MPYAATLPRRVEPPLMSDLNITPLIDVMLVLLIVFIMNIPKQTHKVPIDLPAGHATTVEPIRHLLAIDATGQASFDGAAVTDAALGQRLAALVRDPDALLVMRTDPEARYERFDQLLATVKRAGVTRLGFDGNDRMAW